LPWVIIRAGVDAQEVEVNESRREFTRGAVAAVAGLMFARGLRVAEAKMTPSVVGGVLVGVQSYTYRLFDFDRMIASMRSVGISSLELWGNGKGHPLHPERNSEADFKAVRRKLDDAGITVGAYCANFPPDATDDHLEKAFVGCQILGARVLTSSTEKSLIPRIDAVAVRHKIRVGLHNHWLGDSWFKGDRAQNFEGPKDYAEALAGRSSYMGINLDIGHFSAAGHDPVAFFKEQRARIFSLHVKDRGPDAEHRDMPFGTGATPIAAVMKAAQASKFAYAANLEYEMDEQDPTEGVRASFAYVKRVLLA
jgi:sugar phosphate isomerase/epimerase